MQKKLRILNRLTITILSKFKSNCLIDNHNLQLSLYIIHLIIFVSKININHENLTNLG